MTRQDFTRRGPLLAFLVMLVLVLALAPLVADIPNWTLATATLAAITAVALLGLDLIFGRAGMLAFGHAAFLALGAYIAAIAEARWMPQWPAIAVGLLVSIAVARILAEVFVRMAGVYLAVGTLGFAVVTEGLLRAFPAVTGGASGLVLTPLQVGDYQLIEESHFYFISLVMLAVAAAVYALLTRGRSARELAILRHDDLAAQVLGIRTHRLRVRIFTIGAAYASVAGILLSHYAQVLVPENAGPLASLELISMVVVGGAATLLGPLLGAAFFQYIDSALTAAAQYQQLVYGAVLLLVLVLSPDGITGLLKKLFSVLTLRGRFGGAPAATGISAKAVAPERPVQVARGQVLEIRDATKRFGGLTAVDAVTITVPPGEILALLGPNGAGKTTLLNLISGVESLSDGSIHFGGQDISRMPVSGRAHVGMGRAFQVPRVVPGLSALDNVLLGADALDLDISGKDRLARAHWELRGMGLLADARKTAGALSTGQRKALELARVMMSEPACVLLDEPAVGLTEEELENLATRVREISKQGSSVVVVEHNMTFVSALADRVVVLHQGAVLQDGPCAEVLAHEDVRSVYLGSLG